ncbi:MAG: alpha-glucan family phosphorylase [Tepidisphaerales bacterium]
MTMADFSPPNLKEFLVTPDIPQALSELAELANNLWWVWNEDAIELFRRLDRARWEEVGHNPRKLLNTLPTAKLNEAAADPGYRSHLKRVYQAFRAHMDSPGWFATAHGEKDKGLVAYFSAEFGLHESLPMYSGGLGVLAGDHLKSASEIGLPLIGVGLLYRQGYFQQYLSPDGWQQERYPELDLFNMPVDLVRKDNGDPVRVEVELPETVVVAQVWRVNVGRVPLFLLDTNVADNSPADRDITQRLYGTGTDLRIKQELVLGIGGVRALEAMDLHPQVFHMNEGHSAFLALERIRMLIRKYPDLTFDEARQQVMATNLFTTHTPVPAGIDVFAPETMVKFFKNYWAGLKLDEEGFLALGRQDVSDKRQGFSMAVLAIRLADGVNGVAKLHGEVSRRMWHNLWPNVPENEVPIRSITNGVHVRTWLSPDLNELFERYLGENWTENPVNFAVFEGVDQIPDEELWKAHERGKARLVAWARQTLRRQLRDRGATYEEVERADTVLDPEALTIGFARRFATYKRGALILRDEERLRSIILNDKRPVQFVFAGKAHPADNGGKDLIRRIVSFCRDSRVRRHFVFIENYDMATTRMLVHGVDVWLNNPRRPHEASGTSGMKAAANGVLNFSVLDGWWDEAYTPQVGWPIGKGEEYSDENQQDTVESQAIYETLEREIIPLFYHRPDGKTPFDWIHRMKNSIRELTPFFNTNRMVREYAEMFYLPSLRRGRVLAAEKLARARKLAAAKARLREHWPNIRIVSARAVGSGHYRVGETMTVECIVSIPDAVDPRDIEVQLYSGRLDTTSRIVEPRVVPMAKRESTGPQLHRFEGVIKCHSTGKQGFAIRIVPGIHDLATPFEPGLITWN